MGIGGAVKKVNDYLLRRKIRGEFGYELDQGMKKALEEQIQYDLSKYNIPKGRVAMKNLTYSGKDEVYLTVAEWLSNDHEKIRGRGWPPPASYFKVDEWVNKFLYKAIEEGNGDMLEEMLKEGKRPVDEIIMDMGGTISASFEDQMSLFLKSLYEWDHALEDKSYPEEDELIQTLEKSFAILSIGLFSFLLISYMKSLSIDETSAMVVKIGQSFGWASTITLISAVAFLLIEIRLYLNSRHR